VGVRAGFDPETDYNGDVFSSSAVENMAKLTAGSIRRGFGNTVGFGEEEIFCTKQNALSTNNPKLEA
jgi:hypothetical protein